MNHALIYLTCIMAAACASAAALPIWRRWCWRHNVVDDPGRRKIHETPTPLAGGLAVFTSVLVVLVAGAAVVLAHGKSGQLGLFEHGVSRRPVELLGIALGALIMLLIGLRDDTVDLEPAVKFTGQLLAALIVAASGVRVTLFVHSILFSYAITALWILTVVNALNFMDNMNGLCAGLGCISAIWFGIISAHAGQYLVAAIAFVIAGALLGFLPYNFPRATAFLGDSGSHLVGFLLAVLGILPHFYTPLHPHPLAVLTPLLILAVPLLDLAWVVLLRWRAGQPFYIGDTNHLSHRAVRRGLSARRAVVMIWLLAFSSGLMSYFLQ